MEIFNVIQGYIQFVHSIISHAIELAVFVIY